MAGKTSKVQIKLCEGCIARCHKGHKVNSFNYSGNHFSPFVVHIVHSLIHSLIHSFFVVCDAGHSIYERI